MAAGGGGQVAQTGAKPLAFDVVSVRENKSPVAQSLTLDMGPTPDGYHATNLPLIFPLLTAYVPSEGGGAFFSNDQITGLPAWVNEDRYDISAKVGETELAQWQRPDVQKAMLSEMLRAMFAERFKMVVHRETKEVPVSFLAAGKSGPKFKATNPDEVHVGMTIPFGGVMVPGPTGMNLYGVSMATVATLLTQMQGENGKPIVDKTGLTGKYDLGLRMRERMGADADSILPMTLDDLGLRLEAGKANVERLVIDHLERPSAN